MRFSFFILFSILSFGEAIAQAQGLEKKITVTLSDVTLEKALSSISQISGIEFSYSDDVVPVDARVNLVAEEVEVKKVLDDLLQDFRIDYKVVQGRVILRKAPAPLSQTVRGTVEDEYTHTAIPGATILIADSHPLLGATSDADGKFKIAHVPVGRSTIRITSIGYQPRTLSNVLLGTGKELVLEIKLIESITEVEEVVITARNSDPSAFTEKSVVSARSFSVEETKRYAGSLGDPARMASGFAGVTGASDESNALIVRGNSPRGVLWRIEGIEVPNPNHFATEGSSNGVVSVLSANVLDNSDFLTGAFPAIYGNALSAVFDMKLRNGNNEHREHSFQAGVLGLEASTEGPLSKQHTSSYLVNYRYSTLNMLDKLGVKLNDAGEFKNYQDLSFKLDIPTSGNGRFSVFGIGGLSKSDKQNSSEHRNDGADVGVVGATYQKIVSANTTLLTTLSWSGTNISNYNEVGLDTGVLKVQENYAKSYLRGAVMGEQKISERFFLKGGITYSRLFYNFYLRNQDPKNHAYQDIINFQEQGNTGISQAFLTAHQTFSPTVSGVYGIHFIHFGLTNDYSVEPRVGIRWEASPGNVFSVGYGKHSRIENLQYYLARDHQPGGEEIQVNKNLGFTRANHYVAGYEHGWRKTKAKVEAYYQQLYNAPVQTNPASLYTTLNEDTGFVADSLVNSGKGKNYGIEVSLEKSFSKNFYYILNGSLYQSKFRMGEEEVRNTAYNGNYNFHLLTGKEFRLRDGRDILGVNLKVTTAGGRRYIPIDLERSIQAGREVYNWNEAFNPQLPAYFRTDFQLVYRRNTARYSSEIRLDIQNVTDHANPAYYYYNDSSQSILLKYQVGLLPILSYRIEF